MVFIDVLYLPVISSYTVNRKMLVMVLFWPILAPKYEVPKLNTPKYVTLQKLTAKIVSSKPTISHREHF
jgi:hypothetical protein